MIGEKVRRVTRGAWRALAINSFARSVVLPDSLRVTTLRRCGIKIGQGTRIFAGAYMRPGYVRMGDRCFLNYGAFLDPGAAGILLGNDVVIGAYAVLSATSHSEGGVDRRAGSHNAARIEVGNGCWLGARVTVLPGVKIAPGCIIGAGAVVTRDTEPNGVYVGVPAKRIRDLQE